jgi:Glycosyl transferase family 2
MSVTKLSRRRSKRCGLRISFLIPAYNEAATLGQVLERVAGLPLDTEIVVVDDGSTDETPAILERWCERRPETIVVRQPNRGKGAALRAAIARASGEICVIQDADLEYDPADVPRLVRPIAAGHADVVFGSRLTGGAPQRAFMFWHLVGNRALSLLASLLYDTPLTDIETGYKAFRTDTLRSLRLREDGFGVEPEITAQVCRRRLRIYELPISYYGRGYADGKKITWRHGLEAVRVLFAQRLGGDPEPVGDGRGLRAGADVELGEDARDVDARGLLGHVELRSDLPVGRALGEQLQHLALARGQAERVLVGVLDRLRLRRLARVQPRPGGEPAGLGAEPAGTEPLRDLERAREL